MSDKKYFEAMSVSSATQKALEAMSVGSATQKALASMSISSAAQRALESMSVGSATQKALASMSISSAAQRALESVSLSSAAYHAMTSLSQNESFYESISNLTKPEYLSVTISVINQHSAYAHSTDGLNEVDFESKEVHENIAKVSSCSDPKSFSEYFTRLPLTIQMVIFYILIHVLLPQINSISANLITPHVEKYLSSSTDQNKLKIKEIKSIGSSAEFDTSNLRFITGANVRLRSKPRTDSNIIDDLKFGQVVTVLDKKKNWIKVSYSYEDDEVLIGWVFTRYTAKFKN